MGSKSTKLAQFVRKALLIACVALSMSCVVFGAFSYLFDKISVSGSQSWDQGRLNSGDVEGSTLRLVLTHGQMELRLLRWRAPPVSSTLRLQPSSSLELWWFARFQRHDNGMLISHEFSTQAWIPALLFGIPPAVTLARGPVRRRRRRKRGLCPKCGYNLTANVSGRCPECGAPCSAKSTGPSSMRRG